jgi:hypothetical protein
MKIIEEEQNKIRIFYLIIKNITGIEGIKLL